MSIETSLETANETQSSQYSLTTTDIQARLSLWTHEKLAKELDVLRSSITVVLNGHRPYSVLIPRIARKLKVPKELLRTYLVNLADARASVGRAA